MSNTKIPTAEEFLENYDDLRPDETYRVLHIMQEFAKLHVQAALEAAAKNAEIEHGYHSGDAFIASSSILNAYPLTNIK